MSSAQPADPVSPNNPLTPVPSPPGDLPEAEELTPELLEDEAQRNDNWIRGAVILLAFLLGCTEIGETQTLVHVKTGQYLLSHGVLPPRVDVFSYTAEGRPWVNLSWLFDLALAGVFAIGGAIGLTIFKAILSATAFGFLVNINLRGVSTWWSSVVAGLALLVCHSQFNALPEVVTLLGLALVFWTIQRWLNNPATTTLWLLPVIFAVWANLDPRAFLGLLFLLLYAAGEAIGSWTGHASISTSDHRRHLGIAVASSFAAMLINPFGWHAWISALSLYRVEYPALRQIYTSVGSFAELQYRPITDMAFWRGAGHAAIAWLVVLSSALVSLILNFRRLDWGHTFLFLGTLTVAAASAHELPATAVVLTVIAALNAEAWYRSCFRQTYSVATSEIFFSRGGRALTVLSLFGLAGLAISGRLPMPFNARIGVGWIPPLKSAIDSLKEELADSFDDRPYTFRLQQGDLLIWIGRKVFIDHRLPVYAGTGEDDLIGIHDRTRRALRRKSASDPESGNRETWLETFRRFQLTQAVVPLGGAAPDYPQMLDLLASRDFQLNRIGSSAAIFYRNDPTNADLKAYLAAHPLNFITQAFRTPPEGKEKDLGTFQRDWPAATGAYEAVLVKQRTITPPSVREAQHYQMLLEEASGGRLSLAPDVACAFAHLVIRKANEGLNQNPNVAAAYRMLGTAYFYLGMLENGIATPSGGVSPDTRRYMQSALAYQSSLVLQPDQPLLHLRLGELYARNGKADLAVRHLEAAREGFNKPIVADDEDVQRIVEQIGRMLERPQRTVENVAAELDKSQGKSDAPPVAAQAQFAYSNGCVLKALELATAAPIDFESLPGQVFKAQLLIEAGRPWDADPILERVKNVLGKQPGLDWRSIAALLSLGRGDQSQAIDLWSTEYTNARFQQLLTLAETMPLVVRPELWPTYQTQQVVGAFDRYPHQVADIRFQIALSYLEGGRSDEATRTLKAILEESPETRLRPLIRFYLAQVTGEVVDIEPPSNRIPIEADMFAPENPEK